MAVVTLILLAFLGLIAAGRGYHHYGFFILYKKFIEHGEQEKIEYGFHAFGAIFWFIVICLDIAALMYVWKITSV